ncbi:hypothetical protein NU195Hw_g892t1 [Hortaea werneckii]
MIKLPLFISNVLFLTLVCHILLTYRSPPFSAPQLVLRCTHDLPSVLFIQREQALGRNRLTHLLVRDRLGTASSGYCRLRSIAALRR